MNRATHRTAARLAATALAALALTACEREPVIEGAYKGNGSALFGLAQYEMLLEINGDKAKISMAGQPIGGFQVRREQGRVILYEKAPADGVVFNVENKGNTLNCNQCDAAKLPRYWERQS